MWNMTTDVEHDYWRKEHSAKNDYFTTYADESLACNES